MKKELKKWTDRKARMEATLKILVRAINDEHFRRACLSSDEHVRQAFVDIGEIDVPGDVKVVFVPEGDMDNARHHDSGSWVLEVPPPGTTDPEKLRAYVLCTYTNWFRGTKRSAIRTISTRAKARSKERR